MSEPAYSMTGFARVETRPDEESGEPVVEAVIRAVNHRFLDVKIRSAPEFEACDPLVRKLVKEHVRRGQLQINISLRSEAASALRLDRELARSYLAAYQELARETESAGPPDLTAILRIPGVLVDRPGGGEIDPARLERLLAEALVQALEALNAVRRDEGETIRRDIRLRAMTIQGEARSLVDAASGLAGRFRERLERRLNELLAGAPVDPQRILQEAAVLADRTDVSEELQRLGAHAERLLEMLEEGGEMGKQIDFLAQEMNREANTLLSKTTPLGEPGLPVTEAGLRLKAEIEKIREQSQNLE